MQPQEPTQPDVAARATDDGQSATQPASDAPASSSVNPPNQSQPAPNDETSVIPPPAAIPTSTLATPELERSDTNPIDQPGGGVLEATTQRTSAKRSRALVAGGMAGIVLVLFLIVLALNSYHNSATNAATSRHATATAQIAAVQAHSTATALWDAHLVRVATAQARVTATAHWKAHLVRVATAQARNTATTIWDAHLVRVATAQARGTATALWRAHLAAQAQNTRLAISQATSIARAAATSYAQALQDAKHQASAQATATAQATIQAGLARQAAQPVRVCASVNYDTSTVLCSRSDTSIYADDWDSARLSYTTGADEPFTSVKMHFSISRDEGNGTQHTLGTTNSDDSSLASTNESRYLTSVFAAADVVPFDGITYDIEVDNDNTLLGTTSFTYYDEPAPTPEPSGELIQAIFPPDTYFILPIDSAGGSISVHPLPTSALGWPATPRSRVEYDIDGTELMYRVNLFASADEAATAFDWQIAHLPAGTAMLPLPERDSPRQNLYVVDGTLVDSVLIGNIELTASMPTHDGGNDVLNTVTDLAHTLAQLPAAYSARLGSV